jgi:hypothetical protein
MDRRHRRCRLDEIQPMVRWRQIDIVVGLDGDNLASFVSHYASKSIWEIAAAPAAHRHRWVRPINEGSLIRYSSCFRDRSGAFRAPRCAGVQRNGQTESCVTGKKNRGELPRQLLNIPCHRLCIRTFVEPFYVCPMLPVIPLGPEWLDEYQKSK